jgi:glycosyltransferase involved in cell wall biosynthesis
VGGGPQEDERKYKRLAYVEEHLHDHVFFLGPQGQHELAKLNTIADLGVFPSKDEPFGLVFIETMACGTPVLGAKSGGPLEFVNEDVGSLVDESEDHVRLAEAFAEQVLDATVRAHWKGEKGKRCAEYVMGRFSLRAQCAAMLTAVSMVFFKH